MPLTQLGLLTSVALRMLPEVSAAIEPPPSSKDRCKSCTAPVAGSTVTVISLNTLISVSLAVRRSTYVPATGKVMLVLREEGLAIVTEAGPLVRVQVWLIVAPAGKASSLTVPLKSTELTGRRID